jgi:hypothetical protein
MLRAAASSNFQFLSNKTLSIMTNKEKLQRGCQVAESSFGTFTGGFVVLNAFENANILGGDAANNCQGGNCASGCAENLVAGCGASTNTVAGCGTKQLALSQ